MEKYNLSEELKNKIKQFIEKREDEYRQECGFPEYKTYLIEDCIGEIVGYKKEDEETRWEVAKYIREELL